MTRFEYLDAMTGRLLEVIADNRLSEAQLRREIRNALAEVDRDARQRAGDAIRAALKRISSTDGYEAL